MKGLVNDSKYALRLLVKSPGFAGLAIVTLALGIGVNATIFCVVNEYLFKPLPVRDPYGLVVLAEKAQTFDLPLQLSYPDFEDLRDKAGVFSDLAATTGNPVNLSTGSGLPERVWVDFTTGNYFSMLGMEPGAGRLFTPEEGKIHGAAPVVVLSHAFWQRRFGGATSAIGQSLTMNGKSLVIIGVAPEAFKGTEGLVTYDAYVPLGQLGQLSGMGDQPLTQRGYEDLSVLGRLKPGVTTSKARQAAALLASQLQQEYPKTNKGVEFIVVPELNSRPRIEVAGFFSKIAMVFMALVGLVLLIACVNVASLMLARATARQKEMAIRGALGASRGSLVRLVMIEGVALALLGGTAGLVIAAWAARFLSGLKIALDVPVDFGFSLDWRVFAFTFMAVIFAGILCGVAPAVRASKPDMNEMLKESGRGTVGGGGWRKFRSALVVAQVAVSLLLLISAGLFIRSMHKA
ncbi:MAG TPA: ABC transporter permease, partial [Blastocatellia bacterium]|nr:ABC transporter permease [Blastocatellia bacterium]